LALYRHNADRNDPRRTNKPFFVWYNPARMHITTVLNDKYMAMVGQRGGKDWGVNEAGRRRRSSTRSSHCPSRISAVPSFSHRPTRIAPALSQKPCCAPTKGWRF
jgi:hypothetical protein